MPLQQRAPRRSPRTATPALAPVGALAGLVALGSCIAPRTQITVRVSTDLAPQGPGGALESVLVRVYSNPMLERDGRLSGQLRHELEYPLGVGAMRSTLPADLALVPLAENNAGTVGVEVEAHASGRELFTTRAIASYVSGQHTMLDIFLAGRCRTEASRCDPQSTCDKDGCIPVVRPELPRFDASAAPDATVAVADVGLDAPGDAPATNVCGAAGRTCSAREQRASDGGLECVASDMPCNARCENAIEVVPDRLYRGTTCGGAESSSSCAPSGNARVYFRALLGAGRRYDLVWYTDGTGVLESFSMDCGRATSSCVPLRPGAGGVQLESASGAEVVFAIKRDNRPCGSYSFMLRPSR